MKRKNILLVVLLLILIGGAIGAYMWNKKASTVTKDADFTLQPDQLIKEFITNKKAADEKYIGKGIKFSGVVSRVDGDSVHALIFSVGDDTEVKCTFDKSIEEKVKPILPNDTVELICECGAYMPPLDATSMLSTNILDMARCNLLNWKKGKVDIGTQVETNVKDTTKH